MKERLKRVAAMLAVLVAVCGVVGFLYWRLSVVPFGRITYATVSVEGAPARSLTEGQAAALTGWLRRNDAGWRTELGSRPPAPAAVLEADNTRGKHWRILLFSLPGWRNTVLAADAKHLKAPLHRILSARQREELWNILNEPR